jgi:lipoprotein-anchoring transpeptidase ErfK/SrfK
VAAVLAIVSGVLVLADRSDRTDGVPAAGPSVASSPRASAGTSAGPASQPVHVRMYNTNGATYGVGMPVIAVFSRPPTDARLFARATSVTVDGAPIRAAWYFMRPVTGTGAMEAHLRPQGYWPAHAKVHVAVAAAGVSAGRGLAFDDSPTLDFRTGPATVAVVDDRTHRLTVTADGKQLASYPVSLGSDATPTMRGTKVIVAKKPSICVHGVAFHECGVKYAQQLTFSGEYLLAAPWNMANIRTGVDTSNGCTNLMPADAAKLYATLQVGDVVRYPNATGSPMSVDAGVGDWNVPWATWLKGGLLPTS